MSEDNSMLGNDSINTVPQQRINTDNEGIIGFGVSYAVDVSDYVSMEAEESTFFKPLPGND
jgi:hypothetical protein